MQIRLTVPPEQALLLRKLTRARDEMGDRILTGLHFLGGQLKDRIYVGYRAVLERQTGKLERSIYSRVAIKRNGQVYILSGGVAKRAFYAAFQEKGVKAVVKRKKGPAYILELRARPFIKPAFDDMQEEIRQTIQDAVLGALSGP